MNRLALLLGVFGLTLVAPVASGHVALPDAPVEQGDDQVALALGARMAHFNFNVGALADRYGFHGQFGMAGANGRVWGGDSSSSEPFGQPDRWRWASVTKQVIAVLMLQEVGKGTIDLDAPVARYLPKFGSANAATLSVRQLLRHQSGLPNPENTAPAIGAAAAFHMPGYKPSRDPLTGFCAGPVTGAPGGNWSYNNCDYIVAGALLEAVTGKPWRKLVQERIAKPLGMQSLGAFPTNTRTRPGFDQSKPEPAFDLGSFGSAGALYGTLEDLLKFDTALMGGQLLAPAQLKELWDGQANMGYIALGQWAFTVPLKGCTKPVRIVERRGAIGGAQVRNFILPDHQIAMAAFTDRSEFEFGEIWQGIGFSHDLLALAACGTETK